MFPDFGLFAFVPLLMIGVFGIIFVGIFTLIVYSIVKNVQKARQLGHDPFTMQTELAAKAIDSSLLAPQNVIETRLTELEDLRARGVITEAEYAKARAEAITVD